MPELQSRRWFLALMAAWGALLMVLALTAYGGDATVAEQQDIVAAREPVDRAALAVVAAAGQHAAAQVSEYQLTGRCDISLARDGVDYLRRVNLYTTPGGEAALLKRIADRLPASYQPLYFPAGETGRSGHGSAASPEEPRAQQSKDPARAKDPKYPEDPEDSSGSGDPAGSEGSAGPQEPGSGGDGWHESDGPGLSARVDKFVRVTGGVTGPRTGVVRVEIRTGCRPVDEPVVKIRGSLNDAERAQLAEVFDLLGVTRGKRSEQRADTIECGDGALRWVYARASTVPDRPLGDLAVMAPPDASVLIRDPRLLAYRQGELAVVARTQDGALTVTTTVSDC